MKRLAVVLLIAMAVVLAGCIQFGPGGTTNHKYANGTHVNVQNKTNVTNLNKTNIKELTWNPKTGIKSKFESAISYIAALFGQSNGTINHIYQEADTGIYKLNATIGGNNMDIYVTPDLKKFWLGQSARLIQEGKSIKEQMDEAMKSYLRPGIQFKLAGQKKGPYGLEEYDYIVPWRGQNYNIPLYRLGKMVILPNAIRELFSPNKTEKPEVDLYIMAFCPFGRQAAGLMYPVEKLLGNATNITVHYVIYPASMYSGQSDRFCIDNYCSMHGINETKEDIRQLCIEKYYPHKFWDYLDEIATNFSYSPANIEEKWKALADSLGINTTKIEQCAKTEGKQLLANEFKLDQKYHVSGSPTLIINGQTWNGPRSSNMFKWAVCQAFKKQPKECQQSINETQSVKPAGSCG